MKYLFIELRVQNGEYRYECPSVHTTLCNDINFAGQRRASTFYGHGSKYDDSWEFYGGEVMVKVNRVLEISKEHYDILKQYL